VVISASKRTLPIDDVAEVDELKAKGKLFIVELQKAAKRTLQKSEWQRLPLTL
jgi:hypothetical protein